MDLFGTGLAAELGTVCGTVVKHIPFVTDRGKAAMIIAVHGNLPVSRLVAVDSHITVIDNYTLAGKGTKGTDACSIAQLMVINRGVNKVIQILTFSQGRGFKESVSFEGGSFCPAKTRCNGLRLPDDCKHVLCKDSNGTSLSDSIVRHTEAGI